MPTLKSELQVRLVDNVSGPAKKAGQSIDALRRRANSARSTTILPTSNLDAANRGLALVGARTLALTGGTIALGAAAKRGYTDMLGFERQMTRVGLTAEATDAQIAAATATVRRLAHEAALPVGEVVKGLETLVAQGRSLPDAMSFLPSVAKTAQAAGAEVDDIARSAEAVSTHLKISAQEMQSAFDLMVAGGKAGQFELKDLARYLPSLAPAAKAVGLEGQKGLGDLVAMLQILRKGSGTAEEAAASMNNILQKMRSQETAKRFRKMGVDIEAALVKGQKEGRNLIEVFEEETWRALKGDLSQLPKLINDMEFARGMRALLSMRGAWQQLGAEMRKNAPSATMRDFNKVVNDGKASVDRLSNSWSNFWQSTGKLADAAGLSSLFETIATGANKAADSLDRMRANDPQRNAEHRAAIGQPKDVGELRDRLMAGKLSQRLSQLDKLVASAEREVARLETGPRRDARAETHARDALARYRTEREEMRLGVTALQQPRNFGLPPELKAIAESAKADAERERRRAEAFRDLPIPLSKERLRKSVKIPAHAAPTRKPEVFPAYAPTEDTPQQRATKIEAPIVVNTAGQPQAAERAAAETTSAYAKSFEGGLRKLESVVDEIMASIRSKLNFTVSPTIAPNVTTPPPGASMPAPAAPAPVAPSAPAPGRGSSLNYAPNVRVTVHSTGEANGDDIARKVEASLREQFRQAQRAAHADYGFSTA